MGLRERHPSYLCMRSTRSSYLVKWIARIIPRTSRESFQTRLVYGVITGVLPSASASKLSIGRCEGRSSWGLRKVVGAVGGVCGRRVWGCGDEAFQPLFYTKICEFWAVICRSDVHKPPCVMSGSVVSRRQSRPRPTMSTLLSSVIGATSMLDNAISLPAQAP